MKIKISCQNCGKELETSSLINYLEEEEELLINIDKCEKCTTIAYEKGWREGVAEYLNKEGE